MYNEWNSSNLICCYGYYNLVHETHKISKLVFLSFLFDLQFLLIKQDSSLDLARLQIEAPPTFVSTKTGRAAPQPPGLDAGGGFLYRV